MWFVCPKCFFRFSRDLTEEEVLRIEAGVRVLTAHVDREELLANCVWALRKGEREMFLDVRPLPNGVAMVLTVDGRVSRMRKFQPHEQAEMDDKIAGMRAVYEAKGWTAL